MRGDSGEILVGLRFSVKLMPIRFIAPTMSLRLCARFGKSNVSAQVFDRGFLFQDLMASREAVDDATGHRHVMSRSATISLATVCLFAGPRGFADARKNPCGCSSLVRASSGRVAPRPYSITIRFPPGPGKCPGTSFSVFNRRGACPVRQLLRSTLR